MRFGVAAVLRFIPIEIGVAAKHHSPYCRMVMTGSAGLPAATTPGAMLLATTEPAATTEISPMVTPGRMMAPHPMTQLSRISILPNLCTLPYRSGSRV